MSDKVEEPICDECALELTELLNSQIQNLEQEIKSYKEFVDKPSENKNDFVKHLKQVEKQQIEELEQLEMEEKALELEIQTLEKELQTVKVEQEQ